jgi:serine/threonine-protein kinase
MPSDSSNARDAQHDQTGGAPVPGDAPASVDPEDEGQALLGDLMVGSVVDGKYRVDPVLGRGAMGVVVAATHLHLGERVALKFLRYRSKSGVADDFQTRFRREARVSARLKNEHITRVIDVGVWRDRVPYMVMDYLAGTDLREVINTTSPMPIGTAIEYTVQVCEGIAEAHANGVVHRDLKPSNLFLTKRLDGSDLVKILDFGISKWTAGEAAIDELTQTGVVLGSPKYMAPEQLFGSSDVDARADVWSVGAILYEMLCGRPPFDQASFTKICAELSTDRMPPSLVARRSDIPPELEAVVMKCFVREPELRIRNVADLAGDVLDSVHAPFADAVRAKIASTLEPKSSRDPMIGSGATPAPSGSYGVNLAQSGSGRALQLPPLARVEASGAPPLPGRPARRGWAPWLVAAALVGMGGVVWLAISGRADGTGKPAEAVQAPPAPPTASPSATPAVATMAVTSAAAPPSSSSTPEPRVSPAVLRGWRGLPHVPSTAAPPPTTPPTPTLATATPTSTAIPTATATPAASTDPLGTRQ